MYKVINLLFKVSDVANNSESDKALSYCKSATFCYNSDGTVAVFEDLYGNLWDLVENKTWDTK